MSFSLNTEKLNKWWCASFDTEVFFLKFRKMWSEKLIEKLGSDSSRFSIVIYIHTSAWGSVPGRISVTPLLSSVWNEFLNELFFLIVLFQNISDKFNPGARQMISAGKAYLKALHGAASASRLYIDAVSKLGKNSQQALWGSSADVGK